MRANIASAPSKTAYQVGFWSAILTTAWIILFEIATALGAIGVSTRIVAVGASLLLALSFVVLMTSIHHYAPPEKQIWSHIGLAFAIVYAALLVWNYFLQLTVVRHNPQLYGWLTMDFTPDTAFWSLEIAGYTIMSLSALFTLPIFSDNGIPRVVRWCFAINAALSVAGCLVYMLTGEPLHGLVLASLGVWAIVFPTATALIAVIFKRAVR